MKHKWLPWSVLLVVYAGAFAANVGHFAWSYNTGWLQISASVGYVIIWSWFLVSGYRNQRRLRASLVAGMLTTVGGVLGLLARSFGSGILTILGVMFAGPTITPLYGLLSFIEDYDLFYLAAAAFGAVWMTIGFWMKKKGSDDKNRDW